MKKQEYKTPKIEVIKVEMEDAIMAWSSNSAKSLGDFGSDNSTTSSSSLIKRANSSYSMDDYNWK